MNILITGSSGHAGREIARLLSEHHTVYGLDRVSGPYTHHTGDLTNRDMIKEITVGMDAIIHTASLHVPHISTHSREAFVDTNIKGTLYLLEAAREHGIRKLIYTSTTSLYGESMIDEEKAVWITEEVPTIPRDIYDITKIAAEGLCRDFFDKEHLQTTVLRVSRFWDEPLDKKFFYRTHRGLDVRDVALAHQLALQKDFQQFDVFNISAQSIFTSEHLVRLRHHADELIEEVLPKLSAYYKEKNWEMPSSIDRIYVIDKAKEVLGYEPRFNVQEMLRGI